MGKLNEGYVREKLSALLDSKNVTMLVKGDKGHVQAVSFPVPEGVSESDVGSLLVGSCDGVFITADRRSQLSAVGSAMDMLGMKRLGDSGNPIRELFQAFMVGMDAGADRAEVLRKLGERPVSKLEADE